MSVSTGRSSVLYKDSLLDAPFLLSISSLVFLPSNSLLWRKDLAILFLHSILRLRNHCLCKKTLLCRMNDQIRNSKSWVSQTEQALKSLLLPSCHSLHCNLPSAAAWKKTVHEVIALRSFHELMRDAGSKISLSNIIRFKFEHSQPSQLWSFLSVPIAFIKPRLSTAG